MLCLAVRKIASEFDCDQASVLGAVIAHELGHVLLGTRSHAPTGIMARRLGSREMAAAARGELRFLRAEADQIRVAVERRTTAAAIR